MEGQSSVLLSRSSDERQEMSRRLSKRQLREQQELQGLQQAQPGVSQQDKNGLASERFESGGQRSGLDDKEDVIREEADGEETQEAGEHREEEGAKESLFSKLGQLDEADDASDDASEENDAVISMQSASSAAKAKSRKKKARKSKRANTPGEDAAGEPVEKMTPKSSKAANTANSAKVAKDVSSMSMDEFSSLLESQAQLDQSSAAEGSSSSSLAKVKQSGPTAEYRAHLSLSAPFLDPSIELKRQFGAAAIKAYESENSSTNQTRGGGAANAARARAMARNANLKVRSILVQPQETWPPIGKTFTGMTMETVDDEQRGKVGGWVHSKAYRKAQLQFLQAVQSYEPNHLIALFRLYPWHIDTLLQLSEVSRHQGDLGAASDWNARALFAFERTSSTTFSSSLTSHGGPPPVSFDRIEDRGFWIAAHRHVNFLGRRGTWRTALEWVKLMLGVDPTNDHHGMMLWLDFLSIKSRQHVWFLECLAKMEAACTTTIEGRGDLIVDAKTPFDDDKMLIGEGKPARGSLDWCLGCAYAKALALRMVDREGGHKESPKGKAALRLAIARHPQLLPTLFDKIGLAMPAAMKTSTIFSFASADDDDGDNIGQILTHIYVSRSESLWRDSDTSAWLLETLQEMWPTMNSQSEQLCRPKADEETQVGIYRHILVSDLPDALRQTLIGLMPKHITSNSVNLNSYDPLPPRGPKVTYYNDDYFEPVNHERKQQQQQQRSQSTADAGLMDQFMNAIRGVRGLEAWGNVMENMDDDMRGDIMAQMLELTAQAREEGGMPGTFAREDEDEGEDDDDNDEQISRTEAGANPAPAGAFAALRGVLDRLWGEERAEVAAATQAEQNEDNADE